MKKPETEDERKERQAVELICADIGRQIGDAVKEAGGEIGQRLGFALLIFDFGDGGIMTYSSNAQREDMIRALEECRRNLLETRQ